MTSLTLPYPPSANRLWRSVKGRNIKSQEYREWLAEAALSISLQHPQHVSGPYHIWIVATPPDKRLRDLGNIEKPISDALVAAAVVTDDHYARSIRLEWLGEPIKGGEIRITITGAAS